MGKGRVFEMKIRGGILLCAFARLLLRCSILGGFAGVGGGGG